ncbi:MAG: polyprenyl synthetase family protein [Elusimicrobia bacterium]|nr:polyprenyl synthetase family protein [Elusimicrobiota bacterium]
MDTGKNKRVLEKRASQLKKLTNRRLAGYLGTGNNRFSSVVHSAMRYSVFPGGKRIRPLLTLATADMCGIPVKHAIPVACAIELVHCYSLVHDDLPSMDNDDFRRGKPSTHKKFGEGIAVLAGDALLTMAFGLVADNPDVSRILSRAAGVNGMIGGQIADTFFDASRLNATDSKKLLNYIHNLKTGALLCASITSAGALAGVSGKRFRALGRFGKKIGLAFQITDDIFDNDTDRLTYTGVFGVQGSRRRAEKLISSAKNDIMVFGGKVSLILHLADFVVKRKN